MSPARKRYERPPKYEVHNFSPYLNTVQELRFDVSQCLDPISKAVLEAAYDGKTGHCIELLHIGFQRYFTRATIKTRSRKQHLQELVATVDRILFGVAGEDLSKQASFRRNMQMVFGEYHSIPWQNT